MWGKRRRKHTNSDNSAESRTQTRISGLRRRRDAALSDATTRVYRAAWRDFEDWCRENGLTSTPAAPETVGLYLALRREDLSDATLRVRLAAIQRAQRTAGFELERGHPAIVEILRTPAGAPAGGDRQTAGAPGMAPSDIPAARGPRRLFDGRMLARALAVWPEGAKGKRDRAILLLGLAGRLRRSQIVGLDLADLIFSPNGVRLENSPSDGSEPVALDLKYQSNTRFCAVRALIAWISAADLTEGPLFRPLSRGGRVQPGRLSSKAVNRMVKAAASLAGEDPRAFGAESLRP